MQLSKILPDLHGYVNYTGEEIILPLCYTLLMQHNPQPRLIRTSADNAFAHRTMTHRLPANIRNVIAMNPAFSPGIRDALTALADGIAGNSTIPPLPEPAWDGEYWTRIHGEHADETWHDTPWFFGETYGFRLLLAATRYFESRIDPYRPMKLRELESGTAFLPIKQFQRSSSSSSSYPDIHRIIDALHVCTWGNKADISFNYGKASESATGDRELLLLDHSLPAAEALSSRAAGGVVHIVMDNSGAELAGDLVLALTIHQTTGCPIVLHPKFYPTYVSDTIVEDVHHFLDNALDQADQGVRQFAREVRACCESGVMALRPDHFWCETEFLADMPPRIAEPFRDAALVIIKGDFNYRRVFRDTIWEAGTDPAAATGLYGDDSFDTPLLLLRTMKSDCLAGVDKEKTDLLDASEPGWRTAGKHGVIQLVHGG